MADFSYFGRGKVYVREVGSSSGLEHIGNVSALRGVINENVIELEDYTDVGGGTYNEVRRIQSVEVTATLHDLNADNLARVIFGTAGAISTSQVLDESHASAYPGSFVPTANPAASIATVKVGMDTLTLGEDYTVVPGGILITEDGEIDYLGATVLITYTPSAGNAVEALLRSAKEYEFFFSALNEARSGKPVTFHAYRWLMGPAQSLDLITDAHLALPVTGKLLKDQTKNGTTQSQFFRVAIVT